MYRGRHNKTKPLPGILATLRGISRGYFKPKRFKDAQRNKYNKGVIKPLFTVIAVLAFVNVIAYSAYFTTFSPYAVTDGKKVICYVNSKEDAEKAVDEACSRIASDKKIINKKTNIKVKKAFVKNKKEVSEDPAKEITDKAAEPGSNVKIDITAVEEVTAEEDKEDSSHNETICQISVSYGNHEVTYPQIPDDPDPEEAGEQVQDDYLPEVQP